MAGIEQSVSNNQRFFFEKRALTALDKMADTLGRIEAVLERINHNMKKSQDASFYIEKTVFCHEKEGDLY